MKSLLSLLLILTFCGKALAQALPMHPPVQPTVGGLAYTNAEFRGSEGHLLDLYLPSQSNGRSPVVLWTGGVGWMTENGRESAGFVAQALNPAGYTVVGVSLRSTITTHFPGQLHDLKAAIRWVRANAGVYGLDPEQLVVMGDSAGAWVAVMAALTGDDPALEGDLGFRGLSSQVSAAVAFYPPTDFLQMDRQSIGTCVDGRSDDGAFCHDGPASPESRLLDCAIQTCPERVQQANPVNYVNSTAPPLLLFHGQADQMVPYQQSELLYQAMREACRPATLFTLPDAGHGPFWIFFSDPEVQAGAHWQHIDGQCRAQAPTHALPSWQTIIDFLNEALAP